MRFLNWIRFLLAAIAMGSWGVRAGVVINEVMYHPPEDRDDLQYIELLNAGPGPVSLEGWRFSKGIQATLPATTLPAGKLVLVARDPAALTRQYGPGLPVVATFTGRLKHGGEKLELVDAAGKRVDGLHFLDRAPWPQAPDGFGPSLERIHPSAPGEDPASWAASRLPDVAKPSGTPGRPNSAARPQPLPGIRDVTSAAAVPGHPLRVSARLTDAAGIQSAELRVQLIETQAPPPESSVPMRRVSGDAQDGLYEADIPPVASGRLIRYRVHAVSNRSTERWSPDPEDPRASFSSIALINTNRGAVAVGHLMRLGDAGALGPIHFRTLENAPVPNRGKAAFVWMPTNGGPVQVFDHLRITRRSGGYKIRLFKDTPIEEMTTLNVIFEGRPRWLLSEPLSYEVLERAGVASPRTDFVRLWVDQRPVGYHLIVEQPNKSFLRRVGRDDSGAVYKALWYGNGLIEQNEKKSRLQEGHADLVEVIDGLGSTRGAAQWKWIQERIDVDQFCNYYAASQCIQNWDGFFNNYFVHHDPKPGGKWTIIPWDEDKTWGDNDDNTGKYDWYTMPLTYGMAGDKDPADGLFAMKTQPWGVSPWWRPGGYFSAPLLANREFRARFLSRLEQVNATVFTEAVFLPIIADLERRLEPEIRFRAEANRNDPNQELARFRRHIESLRRQIRERHAFIERELAKAR